MLKILRDLGRLTLCAFRLSLVPERAKRCGQPAQGAGELATVAGAGGGELAVDGDRFLAGGHGIGRAPQLAVPDGEIDQGAGQVGAVTIGIAAGELAPDRDGFFRGRQGLGRAIQPGVPDAEVGQAPGQIRLVAAWDR